MCTIGTALIHSHIQVYDILILKVHFSKFVLGCCPTVDCQSRAARFSMCAGMDFRLAEKQVGGSASYGIRIRHLVKPRSIRSLCR